MGTTKQILALGVNGNLENYLSKVLERVRAETQSFRMNMDSDLDAGLTTLEQVAQSIALLVGEGFEQTRNLESPSAGEAGHDLLNDGC